MKILIFKSFRDGENLAKFVNERKIAKEDILNVTSKNPGHSIFYYGEPDGEEKNRNWFSGFSD
jgi:hypothetical protein